MNNVLLPLQKVPAISKQELLVYIAGQPAAAAIQIVTRAGHTYDGLVISAGPAREEGVMLVMQLFNERSGLTDNFLHIAVAGIESVLVRGEGYATQVLSQGKVQSGLNYAVAGKIDVQRAFKILADTLYNNFSLQTGAPEMELPADGQALNRIVRLTGIIQEVITALLKEADALQSWQQKYHRLVFVNGDALALQSAQDTLAIHFPFNDIEAPEISKDQLHTQLLGVL